MPDAPDHSPASHQDEILLLAEKLGEALDRLNKIESEFTAQTAPLDAAGASIGAANTALQAALKGIEQLSFHVLDNNLGAVSKRLESHEKLTAVEHRALAEKTDQIRIALAEATKYIATRFEKLETQRNEFTQAQASEVDRVRAEFSAGQKNIAGIVETLTAQLADTRREFAEPKSLNPAGKWDAQRPGGYDRLDVVSLNGTSYISKIDGNTEKPSKTSSAWTVLSSRGGSVLAGGGATDITGVAGMGATGLQIAQSPTPEVARDILGVDDFTGATSLVDGTPGRVIQPVAGDQNKYLRADGTWSTVSSVTAPAASQSTVNAGLVDNEYVSPKTNEVRTLMGDTARQTAPALLFDGSSSAKAYCVLPQAPIGVDMCYAALVDWPSALTTNRAIMGLTTAGSPVNGYVVFLRSSDNYLYLRRYGATTLDYIGVKYAGTLATYGGRKRLPFVLRMLADGTHEIWLNGQPLTPVADTSSGTPPAWSDAVGSGDRYVYTGYDTTYNWFGGITPITPIYGNLADAEILTHAQTGLLPDWCAFTGSAVAKTSGTLTIGARYLITSYLGSDSFTNVGAASNATGVIFTATGTTPTTWTSSSQLIKLGPVADLALGPNYSLRDRGANGLHGVRTTGTTYVGPAVDDTPVATVTHSGSGNIQLLGGSALDTTYGWAIDRIIVTSSAAITWSFGNASGGAQYVSAKSLAAGKNILKDSDLVTALTSGANLWSNASAAAALTITIQLIRC